VKVFRQAGFLKQTFVTFSFKPASGQVFFMDISRPLDKFMAIGSYLTAVFAAAVGFIGLFLLTVLVVHFVKKYVMMSK
jgi:hypothetical protein